MNDRIHVQTSENVTRIEMNDGKVNAMSIGMIHELAEAFADAEEKGNLVVLSGRAGMFSAGFDLATFRQGMEATIGMMRAGVLLIERVLRFPFPVLTVCQGHAYPMGAFLMMSADVRLVTAGPWRIGYNEVAIGLTVPHFALELARHRLAPPAFSRIRSGALVDPEEARLLGYVDRVVAPADLSEVVEKELERLQTLDMPSFSATKARVNEAVLTSVQLARESELGGGPLD